MTGSRPSGVPRAITTLVAAVALAACGSAEPVNPGLRTDGANGAIPADLRASERCEAQSEVAGFDWLDDTTPLPAGTTPVRALADVPEGEGVEGGLFHVPLGVEDTIEAFRTSWTAAGWLVGNEEFEVVEADALLFRSGAYAALFVVECGPSQSAVALLYGTR